MFPEKIRFLLILILLVLNPWFLDSKNGFFLGFKLDNFSTIFEINPEEIQRINTRRLYYSNPLMGKMFENKLTFFLDKYKKNFFQGLDLNYYFFANHPRERAGITEREKIYWVWLPVFLIGFVWSLKNSILFPSLISLGLLSLVSFFTRIDSFNFFLIPFFLFNIFYGLKKLVLR